MTDAPTPPPETLSASSMPATSGSKRPWTILGRLSKAVREQNWFAVVLELAIVVLGVFIGLQVNNWNDARVKAATERQYLDRLHIEMEAAAEDIEFYTEGRRERLFMLRDISDALFEPGVTRELTQNECYAVWGSHIHVYPPIDLPTIREVTSSGQFNLVRDEGLRTAIARLDQVTATAQDFVDLFNATRLVLGRTYPDLIEVQYRPADDGDEGQPVDYNERPRCAIEAMRTNRPFLNDFADNSFRYEAYINNIVEPLTQQFAVVHRELDRVLQIGHEPSSSP